MHTEQGPCSPSNNKSYPPDCFMLSEAPALTTLHFMPIVCRFYFASSAPHHRSVCPLHSPFIWQRQALACVWLKSLLRQEERCWLLREEINGSKCLPHICLWARLIFNLPKPVVHTRANCMGGISVHLKCHRCWIAWRQAACAAYRLVWREQKDYREMAASVQQQYTNATCAALSAATKHSTSDNTQTYRKHHNATYRGSTEDGRQ